MSGFNQLIKRASSLIGNLSTSTDKISGDSLHVPPNQGEVIYCKNNVCVHPPSSQPEINHYPGYLTVKGHNDEIHGSSTLILTWIPNSTLKRNPRSVANKSAVSSPCRSTRSSACPSPRHSVSDEVTRSANASPGLSLFSEKSSEDYSFSHSMFKPISSDQDKRDTQSISSTVSDIGSPHDEDSDNVTGYDGNWTADDIYRDFTQDAVMTEEKRDHVSQSCEIDQRSSLAGSCAPKFCNSDRCSSDSMNGANHQNSVSLITSELSQNLTLSSEKHHLNLNLITNEASPIDNTDGFFEVPGISVSATEILVGDASTPTTTTSSHDNSLCSTPSENNRDLKASHFDGKYYIEGTPESLAHAHNLTFPEHTNGYGQSSYKNARHSTHEKTCGVFSIDLAQMRSLRLFYSDNEQKCGQLVIASRQSQYKILHFHHGGLDKLAEVFGDWNFLLQTGQDNVVDSSYHQFSVCQPTVDKEELHPEEGVYKVVTEDVWKSFMNDVGQILDDFQLRKAIFFGGLSSNIRKEAWPLLLHYFPFKSTFDEREQIRNDRYLEYQKIRKKREKMNPVEKDTFWRNVQCIVDKDVVRTDRGNPFFAGEDNPNVEIMRNVLLNYAVYNPNMGYTQGMSDLLAPVLSEMHDETTSFWCFVGLMQRSLFVSSPRDIEIRTHLAYLQELIRIMIPDFYNHVNKYEDSIGLLFCHRWVLLCFKREFKESDALKIWETCWSHYQTDYFHIFICAAIICIYGNDVLQQNLPPDEMLLHFSSLAQHMNGDLVLRKARGLFHQFRVLATIPCTLHGLCEMNGSSMWDTGRVTQINCVCSRRHHQSESCPADQVQSK
ncbi:TBC1D16 (predicted) [Pycnogonum litorale]